MERMPRSRLPQLLAAARSDPAAEALLGWPRRISMLLEGALGMLYLHTRPSPIVHRDFKSANLVRSWGCRAGWLGSRRAVKLHCLRALAAAAPTLYKLVKAFKHVGSAGQRPRLLATILRIRRPKG